MAPKPGKVVTQDEETHLQSHVAFRYFGYMTNKNILSSFPEGARP